MIIKNRKLIPNIPFEEYLALPGWSHSAIKGLGKAPIKVTQKMQLGTHVHNYLLTPETYQFDDIKIVRPIAIKLKSLLGPLFEQLQKEMVVTADFCYNGFILKYKGRIDLGIYGLTVIDLKISEMPLHKSVAYFEYDNQLNGYAAAFDAKTAFIIGAHPIKNEIPTVHSTKLNHDWWNYHISQKGEPE